MADMPGYDRAAISQRWKEGPNKTVVGDSGNYQKNDDQLSCGFFTAPSTQTIWRKPALNQRTRRRKHQQWR